jgi:hypothetical protein
MGKPARADSFACFLEGPKGYGVVTLHPPTYRRREIASGQKVPTSVPLKQLRCLVSYGLTYG